ncbi:Methyltransferase type 12 [Methanocaldococcus villosus KIN24-T80]|uniref:Methyltransferase type 12 n=1 Tax=Methanocaldococcus villosus KIN24-T80 TaxID=1069083 RepID=N6VPK3_9EURY|nr:class I SAM-dependent methyltransferase [Methanocaldococcus villosus]ENN95825.1 Methyltransferase type 12 [Methanocaldococcus villosus KIN24-T80]
MKFDLTGEEKCNREEIVSSSLSDIINEVIGDVVNSELKVRKKIEMLNDTIKYLYYELLGTFIKQGIEFGIFPNIAKYKPKFEEIPNVIKYPNKEFIIDFIKTAIKLNILEYKDDERLDINEFYKLEIKLPKMDNIISDYIMKFNYVTHVARYALISYNHPKIALSFKKDPDIWDMILSSPYYEFHREIAANYLDIEEDDYILDIGCGSRSPQFFIDNVYPKGYYTGVDISKGLLEMAEFRVKNIYPSGYELKNLDFLEVIPKRKYNKIICSHVLKYIPSLKIFIRKLAKSLAPGGKVYISEEFIPKYANDKKDYCEIFGFYNRLNRKFVKYYSEEEIKKELELLGDYRIKRLSDGIIVIENVS